MPSSERVLWLKRDRQEEKRMIQGLLFGGLLIDKNHRGKKGKKMEGAGIKVYIYQSNTWRRISTGPESSKSSLQ